jgi:hypothetical protein
MNLMTQSEHDGYPLIYHYLGSTEMLLLQVTDCLEEIRSTLSREASSYLRAGAQAAIPNLQLADLSANMIYFCAAVKKS